MPIKRTDILRGPAVIEFDGATFHTKGDVNVDMVLNTFDIESSVFGKLDERVSDVEIGIRFEPVGEWGDLTVLFPYADPDIGASVFGATDKQAKIQTKDGKLITFQAGAVTRMPSIMMSATKTLLGECQIGCLGKDNTLWSDAAYRASVAANAYVEPGLSTADVITQPYLARWLSQGAFKLTYAAEQSGALDWDATAGEVETALDALSTITAAGGVTVSGTVHDGWLVTFNNNGARTDITGSITTTMIPGMSVKCTVIQEGTAGLPEIVLVELWPWARMKTSEGLTIEFDSPMENVVTDAEGIVDKTLQRVSAIVRGRPIGVTEAEILAALQMQGSGAGRGRSMNATANHLDLIGTGVYFRLYGAQLRRAPLQFGMNALRAGEMEWVNTRTFTGGTADPVFYVGTTAPV